MVESCTGSEAVEEHDTAAVAATITSATRRVARTCHPIRGSVRINQLYARRYVVAIDCCNKPSTVSRRRVATPTRAGTSTYMDNDDPYVSEQLAAALRGDSTARSVASDELLQRIHSRLEELEETYRSCTSEWVAEDLIYRFWHHSFKVYHLQSATERMVRELRIVGGDCEIHPWFESIVDAGCGKTFDMSHNADWLEHTKPIVDAYFHARYMLEMVVAYGRRLEQSPALLPSGWAAVLSLYQIR